MLTLFAPIKDDLVLLIFSAEMVLENDPLPSRLFDE
jgi:hypothetical protein